MSAQAYEKGKNNTADIVARRLKQQMIPLNFILNPPKSQAHLVNIHRLPHDLHRQTRPLNPSHCSNSRFTARTATWLLWHCGHFTNLSAANTLASRLRTNNIIDYSLLLEPRPTESPILAITVTQAIAKSETPAIKAFGSLPILHSPRFFSCVIV